MDGSRPAGNSMSTTGPVIWITLPIAGAVVAISWESSSSGVSAPPRARCNLDHLAGDVGLADFVVSERVVLDQLFGILGCVLHRDHATGLFARLGFEDGLEETGGHIAGQELLEDRAGIGLE